MNFIISSFKALLGISIIIAAIVAVAMFTNFSWVEDLTFFGIIAALGSIKAFLPGVWAYGCLTIGAVFLGGMFMVSQHMI
ncbi:hypothetical protein [Pseudomonas sp. HY7a-MNA-CIBAN-0227]|uniref:hypothetical protein n=1 Tax=Pseudomonas sp. HY7a-MNA-CIBAN-0227 TaxID=3140474 RepID=UPI003318A1BB